MEDPRSSSPAVGRSGFRLRAAIFALLACFMLFGPFYKQVLGKRSMIFRQWTMFSGLGVGFDEVRFTRIGPDGRPQALDRFKMMGYEKRYEAPMWLKRIPDYDTSLRIGHLLCHTLGEDADVRIASRRATPNGWVTRHRPDRDVCLTKPKGRVPDPNPALHQRKRSRP